ncbi:MAG: PAS domain S-box protein, partial [Methanoregula sp.]|nr:PAS domain S-box protein [Methanoregula sp.]
ERMIEWYDKTLRGADGSITGLLAIGQDVTDRKKAEESLHEAALRWQSTFDSTQDGICIVDADQRILTSNRMMQEIVGVKNTEDIVGRHCYEVVHKTTGPIPGCPFVRMRNSRTREQMELKIGDRWVIVTVDPILDKAGTLVGAVHNIRDITERKNIEETIRESEERFRSLFDSTLDMIQIIRPDGSFIHVNPAWKKILGYPNDDIRTMSVFDIFHPDSLAHCTSKFNELCSGAEALQIEAQFLTKDKKTISVEGNCIPKLKDGIVVSIRGIFHDITEQKRVEQALADEATKYKILIEQSRDGIVILDQNGKVYEANRRFADMLGYSSDEIQELYVWDWDTQIERAQLLEMIRTVDETGDHFETKHYRKDGTILDVEISTNATVFNGKKLIFCVVRDITERKRAEEALRQVNRQLNLLSSITRHDILNQLLVLKGYLELSHDNIDKPEAIREFIEKEQKAANTIEHQIIFTKDYQNLGTAAPSWQNVNASINKALRGLPMRAVHAEPDPADPEVFADPLFEKVFYNLIDNALRYGSDQMKTIRFSSHEIDTGLQIVCEDDGVGIPRGAYRFTGTGEK